MRMLSFFLFATCLSASATGIGQTVTLSGDRIPIKTVFAAIEKQTGYVVGYRPELFAGNKTVSVSANKLPLRAFLDLVFKDQPVKYDIQDKTIFLSRESGVGDAIHFKVSEFADNNQVQLRIRVTDQEYNPLAGATVTNKKTKLALVTKADGWISIAANPGEVIEITYAGYMPYMFTVKDTTKSINIRLNPRSVLDEAVVYNGYQKIQQKFLTGSVTSLKMDSIIQPGLNTVDKMLEGRVPGLTFMQNSGQAGAAPKLRIRGTNTYLGSREPLWVVDGIVRTSPFPIPAERINDPDFVNLLGNAVSGLNPYDIDQIDVLKDATAAALYGVRAANGVIVITTKRGKPGPPTVNYNVTTSLTRRPRYTDRSVYMMNSRERVDVSREMIEKNLQLRGTAIEAYEKAIIEYYSDLIDYNTFKERVGYAETVNTDWLGNTMRDVFASNHTISVTGGNSTTSYRASVGYRNEPGVIKKESNDLYTGLLNMQMNYRKFKVDFNIQLSKDKRRYTPVEVGVMNYSYGTSRAISAYKEDGSYYFYPTISSSVSKHNIANFNTMNILNEMDNSGEILENNEYTASVDASYEIVKGLQFNARLAYTGGNSNREIWFTENTEWATQLRINAYNTLGDYYPAMDMLPFGGELRQSAVRRENYMINGRLNYSSFLDQRKKHQLTAEVAMDLLSNKSLSVESIDRGYYPNRGRSFAQIDLGKYTTYADWLSRNSDVITEILQNSIRPYITGTYIFNDRYVFTATTSQEFSNSFGNRSNEKFLPTWALSGRWNIHEDLLRNVSWIDRAALLMSFGTRGNMIAGQTPYVVIRKGGFDSYLDEYSSLIQSFPNPDLAWEKTQDYNGTFQFSILNGRINGSLGYFFARTTNAFLSKKVSAVNGAPGNNYVVNGGILENQGVEISMNFKVIDNLGAGKNGFMWRFDPQLGQVFNRLINTNLNSRNVMVDVASLNFQNYLDGSVPVNGKSVNTFYSYRFKTLDPKKGYPVFYGAEPASKETLFAKYNAMLKDDVYSAVMIESGRREPVLQGSVNNSFTFRNWTLNVTFSYSVGNKIRMLQIASGNYGTFRPSSQQNLRKEFTQRWRYPGDERFTDIPAIQGEPVSVNTDETAWWTGSGSTLIYNFATDYYQMYDFSDLRVVKGDYLKLQYISLSYRLADVLCRKLNCKAAFVQLSGNNLFTIANKALRGQDPSQSGTSANINLSVRPVYAFNLNISF